MMGNGNTMNSVLKMPWSGDDDKLCWNEDEGGLIEKDWKMLNAMIRV